MAKSPKRTKPYKGRAETQLTVASEPQAVYTRRVVRPSTRRSSVRKGYDAKRSAGMLPGIAERMKDYLKSVRDGR